MDKQPFISAIEQICEEKGISKDQVIETIEMAIAAAYKKDYGKKGQNIKVDIYLSSGKMKFLQVKTVVDESMLKPELEEGEEEPEKEEPEEEGEERKIRFNPEKHIMLEEAQEIKEDAQVGDELEFDLETHEDYGRIAAQTAKQVIIQRIREAEKDAIFSEFKEKEGQLVSGIVQRVERGNVFVDINKTTGILFPEEQIPGERYRPSQRLRVYIKEVKKDSRGPDVVVSRAAAEMVSQLFALEVPEFGLGTVEIKAIAREPGSRTKVAVWSEDEAVDPIGAVIGQKGTRVQAVINELGGEKIDVIEWSESPVDFISAALSPAKVNQVDLNEEKKEAKVIVPDDQLSLAIGIKGQNVRLAARLTGWKIDIASAEAPDEPVQGSKKTTEETEEATEETTKTETQQDSSEKKTSKKTSKAEEK